MLKQIPSILSPEVLKTLMEMGHGDELVLADGNFPSASMAARLVRCDGNGVSVLLDAVLQLMPLDQYVRHPACLMSVVPGDPYQPGLWPEYAQIIGRREARAVEFEYLSRESFYERARRAFAVFSTSERGLYANIILKKGVVQ